MSDIDEMAVFIKERRDEDEEAARESLHGSRGEWAQRSEDADLPQGHLYDDSGEVVVYDEGRPTGWQFDHIASHDPARVLREVAADRKLLDLYEQAKRYRDQVFARPEPRSVSDEMRAVTEMLALEQVLRLRVAVWSDHPDCKAGWKQ